MKKLQELVKQFVKSQGAREIAEQAQYHQIEIGQLEKQLEKVKEVSIRLSDTKPQGLCSRYSSTHDTINYLQI